MFACAPLLLACASQAEAWRIVPGTAPDPLPVPAERLRSTYLPRRGAEIVPLARLDEEPSCSRMVVGLPAVDAPIAALAARYGASVEAERLVWRGRALLRGQGLRLAAPDPDGGGMLILVIGADEAGLRAPFTVRLDMLAAGYTIASEGRIVEEGALPPFRDEEYAPLRPLALRHDLDVAGILAQTADWPAGERARRLARAFSGYGELLEHAAGTAISGEEFFAALLRAPAAEREGALQRFAARPLQDLADKLWMRAAEVLGPVAGPAPQVHFLIAPAHWTNAASWDAAEAGDRPRVLINLAAMPDHPALETALAHEFVHARQPAADAGLLGRCAHEGAAVFLSQELIPGTPAAAALMWSAEQLREVEEMRAVVLARFREDALGDGRPRIAQWTRLDQFHEGLPGTPSRLGYWVGWTAARAWRAAHPDAPLADLLSVPAAELLDPILR